ncbi:transglutaminase domain-containing protein [Thermoplasmatota archaeon]
MTPYITSYITYNSEQSQLNLHDLVDDIVDGLEDDESKTLAILRWFDRGENKQENISNMYYRFNQKDALVLLYSKVLYEGFIYSKYPFFGFRFPDTTDNWYSWIYHSRIGRCGEYSRLCSVMCHYANISVREVSCNGEDHDWNEVKIENEWIVIDATTVNLPCKNGYNISRDFMENKVKGDLISNGICVDKGNVSYVYALYPDNLEYEEDITDRYTDVVNISIKVIDNNDIAVEGAKIKVYSQNRLKKRYTGLYNSTNESGIFIFRIGGGNYTFEASYNGKSGMIRDSFSEDISNHYETIIVK